MKRTHTAAVCALCAFAAAALSAQASLTNVMKNVTDSSTGYRLPSYMTLSNWELSDGSALTAPPTNVTDDVLFKDIGYESSPAFQTVYFDVNTNLSIASLSGDFRRTFGYSAHSSDYSKTPDIRMSVGDLSGWKGAMAAYEWNAGFSLADGQTIAALEPYSRVPVTVPSGAEARVDTFRGDGTVRADGAGRLEVGPSIGRANDLNFQVTGSGTLAFDGSLDESSVEATLAKAALHLDASRAETVSSSYEEDEGDARNWVTTWSDVRGEGYNYVVRSTYTSTGDSYWVKRARPAFVSSVVSPTQRHFVDFGARVNTGAAQSGVPTNCMMDLKREITGIRAVIMVVRAQDGGNLSGATVLGHSSKYDLATEGANLVHGSGLADARFGEAEVDGVRGLVATYGSDGFNMSKLTGLHVIAMQFRGTGTAAINLIGSDRHYTSRSCGFMLGELLVFTNDLTRVERYAASRYLANKWKGDDEMMDAGSVIMGASASISVADGKTASVREVSAKDGRITKTGGGTLRMGRLVPETTSIDVAAGGIDFESDVRVPSTSAPATNAYIWLDAQKVASLVTNHFGTVTNYVTEWKDCRADKADTVSATSYYTEPPRIPYLVENAWGTRPAISFGDNKGLNTRSWMKFPNWKSNSTTTEAFAGFMVMRPNVTGSSMSYFGYSASLLDFMRNTPGLLLATNYYQPEPGGATWTINGRVVDPYANEGAYINQTTNFVLIAFSSQRAAQVNCITKDRYSDTYYKDNCGDISIGEMIVYNHKITEREFRDTEAYLMEKWGLGAHPDAQTTQKVKNVTFGAGASAVIGGGNDVYVESISSGDGTIVKTGSGSLSVCSPSCTAVTVEGGTLELRPYQDELMRKALWHFDVSDASCRVEETTENGDGSVTTNVTKLLDVRKNGLDARSTLGSYPTFVMAHPTLTTATMPDGSAKTVLDFGHNRNTSSTSSTVTDAAGMLITRNGSTSFTGYNKIRESFTVISDANGGYGQIMGCRSVLNYLRNTSAPLLNTNHASEYVKNGYIAVDGVVRSATYSLPAGFHVISFGATGNTESGMLVQDRNCTAGGSYFAEQVVFTNALTQAERTMMETYLAYKWFGGDLPSTVVGDLSVASGATFSVGEFTCVASSLSGGGTVVCGKLSGIESLTVEGPIEVQGEAAFGDSVAVTVVGGVELRAPGTYPIFTAAGYGDDGLDLTQWTLSVSNPVRGRFYSLVFKNGSVCLKVETTGAIMLIK